MDNPIVENLSHITFITADLDAMDRVLTRILGAKMVYDSGPKLHSLSPERFYVVGASNIWIAVMQGYGQLPRSYNHLAFKVSEHQLKEAHTRAKDLGLEVRPARPRKAGEGQSLYFYDYDNHLFELHTGTLAERLAAYGQYDQRETTP